MPSCMSYLGLTFGILSLGCAACALGLNYWIMGYFANIGGDLYSGLWERCVDTPYNKTCQDFETFDDDYMPSLNAVRSMVIIGTFFILIAVLLGCVALVVNKLSEQIHLSIISTVGMAIGGLTFGILSLGCAACALGLNYWIMGYFANIGGDLYSGLWERCVDTPYNKTCQDFETFDDDYMPSLNAVRSMVIIGTFFILIAVLLGCVALVVNKLSEQIHLSIISTVGMAIGGLFLMVGFSVYLEAIFYPIGWAPIFDLHAGFILCVVGWLLAWFAAILILTGTLATRRQKLLNL